MHFYTNNEKTEREFKETIPLTSAMKRIKYLGINLPKETKDLYIESYKTLMKEIKEDINRWRNIPCSAGVQLQQPGIQLERVSSVGEKLREPLIFLGLPFYFKLMILFHIFTKALGQRFDIFSSH